MSDIIEKIGKVDASEGSGGTSGLAAQEDLGPNKAHFDDLMQRVPAEDLSVVQVQDPSKIAANAAQAAPTPMQALMDPQKAAKITPPELIAQTQEAITKIKDAKTTLSAPDIAIKKSAQRDLHSRLTHINENIQIALSKTGVEVKDPASVAAVAPRGNIVEKFLGMLTHGQHQMHALTDEIDKLNKTGGQLSPGQMFAMQIKVGNVTAELEFFTATLAKSIESVKTLMNVQV